MRVLRWPAIAVAVTAVAISLVFFGDMNRAYERVREKGAVISSAFGDIEFTEGGSGPEVLVIHGSGGGYDQGELIAEAVLGNEFHWITPSRFGYLRSTFRAGATWDDQAHAYAALLDELGITEVAVVAMSQGGPSALIFAVLYPERITSLTLISCGVTNSITEEQTRANEKGDILTTIYEHDILYWLVAKFFRKRLLKLIGADEVTLADLGEKQKKLLERFIDQMNPVSLRSAGVTFDNKAKMPGERIAMITTPTLILHATDDTLQLYHNAEFAAAAIPTAELVRFERGGHFLIGIEQSTIRTAVASHLNRKSAEQGE